MNLPIRKLQGGKEYKKFLGGKPLTRNPNWKNGSFLFCDINRISQLFQRSKSTDMLEKSQVFEHRLIDWTMI
jgi:hypothetical protein